MAIQRLLLLFGELGVRAFVLLEYETVDVG
jgi:hypothetical protein